MSRTDELRARVESLGNAWEQFKAAKKNELAPTVSLRDYFAAAALQGLLAGQASTIIPEDSAGFSYRIADAMLKARSA